MVEELGGRAIVLEHDRGKGVAQFFTKVVLTCCIVRMHGPILIRSLEIERKS